MKSFRIYHLLLAIGVAVAYFTAEELGLVHAWTGYAVGLLVVLRLVLGLAGRQGFRFARLNPTSGAPAGQGGLRHPSIGNALTLALILCIAGVDGTGSAMDRGGTLVGKSIRADDGEHEGGGEAGEDDEHEEEAALLPALIIPPAMAEDGEEGGEEEEGPLAEVHETLGNAILPLALLHIAWLLAFRFAMARFVLFLNPRAPRLSAGPKG